MTSVLPEVKLWRHRGGQSSRSHGCIDEYDSTQKVTSYSLCTASWSSSGRNWQVRRNWQSVQTGIRYSSIRLFLRFRSVLVKWCCMTAFTDYIYILYTSFRNEAAIENTHKNTNTNLFKCIYNGFMTLIGCKKLLLREITSLLTSICQYSNHRRLRFCLWFSLCVILSAR